MSRKIISHVETDIGRRRDSNEDNFVWLENLWGKPATVLIGAIDGVGGYEGGEIAARMAKEIIEAYLQNFSFGAPLQLLKEALINANNKIYEERMANADLNRMSCVLSVAILDAEKEMMYIGHVGDSRGYIYRNAELIKITKDHSAVGMKEDSGYLTEEEAMHHPRRNEISKMLGEALLDPENKEAYIDITEHSFLAGDVVMFCSDGLTDLVTRTTMLQIMQQDIDIPQKVQQLIDKANELGGKDNITVAMAYLQANSAKKKNYKRTIEVPVNTGEAVEIAPAKKAPRKKKAWLWLLPVVFLAGYLANWAGTKNLLQPKSVSPAPDTVYIQKDTLPKIDSMPTDDSLIQATDTIYRDRARQTPTGY